MPTLSLNYKSVENRPPEQANWKKWYPGAKKVIETRCLAPQNNGKTKNWKHILKCYMISNIDIHYTYLRGSEKKESACRGEEGSKRRGYVYTYGWFILRFDRKQENSVKQLSFN